MLGLLALLVLIGVICSPGLHNTFIGWDDRPYIRGNTLLRSLDGLARRRIGIMGYGVRKVRRGLVPAMAPFEELAFSAG